MLDLFIKNSGVILSSGLFASLITLLFTRYDGDKKIITEHITKERQLWREQIRSLVVQVNNAYQLAKWDDLLGIEAQFHVLINPYDENDQDILRALKKIRTDPDKNEHTLNIFNKLVSRLLKHDWDRVKSETSFFITARGIFLAFIAFVFTVPMLFRLFNEYLTEQTALIFILGCILGLPIAYEYFLTLLDEFVASKFKNGSRFIHWLKNKAYREKEVSFSNINEITICENPNEKSTYIVTVSKL